MFEALRKLFRRDIQDHPNAFSADKAQQLNVKHDAEVYNAYLEREVGYLDLVYAAIEQAARNGRQYVFVRCVKPHPSSSDVVIPSPDYELFIIHQRNNFKRRGYKFQAYQIGAVATNFSKYIEISW